MSARSLFAKNSIDPATFRSPGTGYGIRCWWWWLNGNVTRESILRDLLQMKAKGFSGACIFDAGGADQRGNRQVPEGPMFGSPAWRELYLYAIREADKLGLVMSLNIQSGWNLGGPDITPEESAKQVVFSEMITEGGRSIVSTLEQPKTRDGYYRDIAVLAIPFKERNRLPIRDFENKAATREVGWSVPETRPLLTDTTATPGEEDAAARRLSAIMGDAAPPAITPANNNVANPNPAHQSSGGSSSTSKAPAGGFAPQAVGD
ncbi:MAG: hypothetical protein EOO38_06515 [Cytophagaceae bacterium]|nr:MAG: hypothetical protein EOO38_06515 [Cytophagaceae bacterium]